ncbi:MAG: ribonuclease P protein component [Acholeplasmataceae bacterium]|jgi:ribonuclease P protein component
MQKKYRIKKTSEIDAIFNKKIRINGKYFNIFYQLSDVGVFRFAISIGKKYGNAVKRNLMKRRIREIIRESKDEIKAFDFVIAVKPNSNELDFETIKLEILKLLKKAKIMEDN